MPKKRTTVVSVSWLWKALGERTRWSHVQAISELPVVRTAGFWFVVVPLAGRFFSKISDTVQLTLFGHEFSLNLQLPFSWKLFYFGAVLFFIGQLLFKLSAPDIVTKFSSVQDFEKSKRGGTYIVDRFFRDYIRVAIPRWYHRGRTEEESDEKLSAAVKSFLTRFGTASGLSGDPYPLLNKMADAKRRRDESMDPYSQSSEAFQHWDEKLDEATTSFSHYAVSWGRDTTFDRDAILAVQADKQGEAFWYVRDIADSLQARRRGWILLIFIAGLVPTAIVAYQSFCFVLGDVLYGIWLSMIS